jgi:hypothetical protein
MNGDLQSESRDHALAGKVVSGSDPNVKDVWDKVDIIGKVLGSVLIPLALAGTGFFVNLALQDRAAKEKKFETAITVLQSKNPATSALREWALTVFEDTVHPPSAVITQLQTSPLPSSTSRPGDIRYVGSCENKSRIMCYNDQNGLAAACSQQPC